MAEPLPPEGYIRIKDAYDTFIFGMLGELPDLTNGYKAEHAAFSEKIDDANRFFTNQLSRLSYGGRVVGPDGKPNEITGEIFDRSGFADLLPLHNAIPPGTSGPLGNYVGGIVYFDKARYFEWLPKELSVHFHGEIQNGDLQVSDANERLVKLGLPVLHALPALADYKQEVLEKTYWTLPMAVAWIAWRNIDDVVKQFGPYAQHGGYWRDSKGPNQSRMGATWEPANVPSLTFIDCHEDAEAAYGNPPLKPVRKSQDDLWSELQSGQLFAVGIESGGSHRPIAKERWVSLQPLPFVRGREYIGAGHEKISDVEVPAKDVLRIWPETPTGNHAKPKRLSEPLVVIPHRPPKKVGPKPKVDPLAFEKKAHEIISYEGLPDPKIDASFRQSDLETKMMKWHNEAIGVSRNRELTAAAIRSYLR